MYVINRIYCTNFKPSTKPISVNKTDPSKNWSSVKPLEKIEPIGFVDKQIKIDRGNLEKSGQSKEFRSHLKSNSADDKNRLEKRLKSMDLEDSGLELSPTVHSVPLKKSTGLEKIDHDLNFESGNKKETKPKFDSNENLWKENIIEMERIIQFKKTEPFLGITLTGGLGNGLHISKIKSYSLAYKQGFHIGDKIISLNDVNFSTLTKDEALKVVKNIRMNQVIRFRVKFKHAYLQKIKQRKYQEDNFYIRCNFNLGTVLMNETLRSGQTSRESRDKDSEVLSNVSDPVIDLQKNKQYNQFKRQEKLKSQNLQKPRNSLMSEGSIESYKEQEEMTLKYNSKQLDMQAGDIFKVINTAYHEDHWLVELVNFSESGSYGGKPPKYLIPSEKAAQKLLDETREWRRSEIHVGSIALR